MQVNYSKYICQLLIYSSSTQTLICQLEVWNIGCFSKKKITKQVDSTCKENG